MNEGGTRCEYMTREGCNATHRITSSVGSGIRTGRKRRCLVNLLRYFVLTQGKIESQDESPLGVNAAVRSGGANKNLRRVGTCSH